VAYILDTEADILEEGILDKDEYVDIFSNFFVKDGKQAIIIHFQPMAPPAFGNH